MNLRVPREDELAFETERLLLEPIKASHADEMVGLMSDQALYRFLPSDPPSLETLKERFRYWEKRSSPDGAELWLNWAARRKSDAAMVGHFQAGVKGNGEASIAYMVGLAWQRQGYATEALARVCLFLRDELHANPIKAWIDTRNVASIALVEKLGMVQVGFVENADHFKGSRSDEFVFELAS